jgi:hypothetical protein
MTSWQRTRAIVENDGVATKRDAVTKDFPRFDSLWIGITWIIARKGDKMGINKFVNGVEYRLHVFAGVSDDFPEVTLLYTVDKDSVIIHDIGIEIGKEAAQPATVAKIH